MRFDDLGDYFRLRRLVANPWQVLRFRRQRALDRSVSAELLSGPRLKLRGGHSDFHTFHRIYLRDEYRLDALPAGRLDTVVDLGANIGVFATRAAGRARRVIACEPMPDNFAELEANTRGVANVSRVRAAISASAGRLQLYRPRMHALTATYSAHPDPAFHETSDPEIVPALTLDQLFEQQGVGACDLLKIDIEGHEYEVLHAASPATLARIRRIHGEYHDVRPADPRTRIESFRAWLESRGFRVELRPHRRKPNHGLFFAAR